MYFLNLETKQNKKPKAFELVRVQTQDLPPDLKLHTNNYKFS